MTREEELLERIEEQKKYIKLLEEQNEALQKKTGDAIKELDQFRQVEQAKLDRALDDDLDLDVKSPYKAAVKKHTDAYAKKFEDMAENELKDALEGIEF